MKKIGRNYALDQSPFYKLHTQRKLAALLRISLTVLRSFKKADTFYRETDIPKKDGGIRRIENPSRNLKIVQARIARVLGRIEPPDYLFCPVKGRSYVDNAARHLGHRVVRTLDIKKYFPNTSRNRVYKFFLYVMKCNPDVACLLADIATYKGHLPTGSPLSPIMAYCAHLAVWEEVDRIVKKNGAVESLYIDDLTISGAHVPKNLMWQVKKVIHQAGLRYHKEKTFRDRPAEVTGVIIRGGKLVAPNRQLLKRYRVEGAARRSDDEQEKKMLEIQLSGLVGQIKQISRANATQDTLSKRSPDGARLLPRHHRA
jgi:retron-type reverse transcriptase